MGRETERNLGQSHLKDCDVINSDVKEELFDSGFSSEESINSASDIENVAEGSVASSHDSTTCGLSKITTSSKTEEDTMQLPYPDSLYHLLIEFLDLNPFTRITAEEALKHPFIQVSFRCNSFIISVFAQLISELATAQDIFSDFISGSNQR